MFLPSTGLKTKDVAVKRDNNSSARLQVVFLESSND